ncbi:MAG TPA: helix-turn-helix domain-containing protein [Intrasporangium sp.]|uniref:helix-turn-helix domain-containing protein n=1 Tax=Intrasporangium sp. TaxID=1925024 RepID=UPI002F95BA98
MTRHPSAPRSVTPAAPPPGHEIADRLVLTRPAQVRALGHPLRTTILGLLTERAASVAELAEATHRPKSTIAHHVSVLHLAGLVQVVRTRRVRAVEERFYGRAARTVTISVDPGGPELPLDFNDFEVAARESSAAYEARRLWAFLRHARLSDEQASEFWTRIRDLVEEYDRLPRSGDTTYGLAVGIYPVPDYPRLPDPREPGAPDAG